MTSLSEVCRSGTRRWYFHKIKEDVIPSGPKVHEGPYDARRFDAGNGIALEVCTVTMLACTLGLIPLICFPLQRPNTVPSDPGPEGSYVFTLLDE